MERLGFLSLVVHTQEWQLMQKTVNDWQSLIYRLTRREKDEVKVNNFCGLVEKKPLQKLKEWDMKQADFKLLLDTPKT